MNRRFSIEKNISFTRLTFINAMAEKIRKNEESICESNISLEICSQIRFPYMH